MKSIFPKNINAVNNYEDIKNTNKWFNPGQAK